MAGCIKLGKINLPEPGQLGIEVRTTTTTYDLKTLFPGVDNLIGEREITVEHGKHRRLKMEIMSNEGNFRLKVTVSESTLQSGYDQVKVMVMKNEIHTEVKALEQGIALFEDIQHPADLQLKIFI